MTHVVAEPCFNCKYTDCVVVCPVECFKEGESMLFIHPEECIDCEACVPECPPQAIFHEDNLPESWLDYIKLNAEMSDVCPSITESKEPLGPPIEDSSIDFIGAGKDFVAYHNTQKIGNRLSVFIKGERRGWDTGKSPEQFLGGRVWCVSGEGVPRQYYLHGYFVVDELDYDDSYYQLIGEVGSSFSRPYPLSGLTWMKDFLKSQANFSVGIQRMAQRFVEEFEKIELESIASFMGGEEQLEKGENIYSPTNGQGFQPSPELRKAIEEYAVNHAKTFYEKAGWSITLRGKPYDLECRRAEDVRYVEVKGCQGPLDAVVVTHNEVEFARQNPGDIDLYVVHNIEVVNGVPKGGEVTHREDWRIDDDGSLRVINYKYSLK